MQIVFGISATYEYRVVSDNGIFENGTRRITTLNENTIAETHAEKTSLSPVNNSREDITRECTRQIQKPRDCQGPSLVFKSTRHAETQWNAQKTHQGCSIFSK